MRYWVGLIGALSMLYGPAFADYDDGLRAFNGGDFAAAFVEWRASAAEGDDRAQFQLGRLYEQGLGVPQNFVQAHAWYSVAAAKGNAQARTARDTLGDRMTPEQRAKAQGAAARLFAGSAAGGQQAGAEGGSPGTADSVQADTQTSALPAAGDRFDGHWRGGGQTDARSPRQKCGSGPQLSVFIAGKTVTGKLVLVVAGKNQSNSEVVLLEGQIDAKGRFTLKGRGTEVTGRLDFERRRGSGAWIFAARRCSGDFQITKRG